MAHHLLASEVVQVCCNKEERLMGPSICRCSLYCDFEEVIDASGCSVIPGLVDAHTHLVWVGDKVQEFAMNVGSSLGHCSQSLPTHSEAEGHRPSF